MLHGKEIIVILGCSSKLGSYVAHAFAESRYQVVGLDWELPKITSTNFTYYRCNLEDEAHLYSSLSQIRQKFGDKIASFIHLAELPIEQMGHLVDTMQSFHIEQYLYLSTHMVHASSTLGEKISELSPLKPKGEVAKRKLAIEECLKGQLKSCPLVILRAATGYEDICLSHAISRQIQKIYERKPISWLHLSGGANGAAYIHNEDLAMAIWLTVQRRFGLPKMQALLIAEPETVCHEELQRVISILCHGIELKTYKLPSWLTKLVAIATGEERHLQNFSIDITQAEEKLGWSPKRSLRKTLPVMIASLKENPLSWYRQNGIQKQTIEIGE